MLEIHKIDIKFQVIEVTISDGLKKAIETSKIPTAPTPLIPNRGEYSIHDLQAWLSFESREGKQTLEEHETCECVELIARLNFLKEEDFYIKQ